MGTITSISIRPAVYPPSAFPYPTPKPSDKASPLPDWTGLVGVIGRAVWSWIMAGAVREVARCETRLSRFHRGDIRFCLWPRRGRHHRQTSALTETGEDVRVPLSWGGGSGGISSGSWRNDRDDIYPLPSPRQSTPSHPLASESPHARICHPQRNLFNQGPRDKPRRIGIRSRSHQHETWPPVVMLGGDGYRPQALGWWTVLLTTESSNGGKEGRIVAVW
jgi:hypothetical protein